MTIDTHHTSMRLMWEDGIEHGVFHRGERATSKIVGGFSVLVDEVLSQ